MNILEWQKEIIECIEEGVEDEKISEVIVANNRLFQPRGFPLCIVDTLKSDIAANINGISVTRNFIVLEVFKLVTRENEIDNVRESALELFNEIIAEVVKLSRAMTFTNLEYIESALSGNKVTGVRVIIKI